MTLSDPVKMAAAWALCILSLYYAFRVVQLRSAAHAKLGATYSPLARLQDLLLPLGFGMFGLRLVLTGAGILSEDGWGSHLLYALAAGGFIGGYMASRIRRMD